MLRLDHVSKGDALQDVSITFRSNELVSWVIENDEVRKVVCDLIAGIEHYNQGDLLLNDCSTKLFKNKQWKIYRKWCVGIVTLGQMNDTILETVEMGLVFYNMPSSLKRRKAKNALLQVGFQGEYQRLVCELSTYEKYCLAIAKAIVSDAKIILVETIEDELNVEEKQSIYSILNEVADERLVIVFEKKKTTAPFDRQIFLEDGKITYDSHPAILTKKEKGMVALPAQPFYFHAIKNIALKNVRKNPLMSAVLLLLMGIPYFIHNTCLISAIAIAYLVIKYQKSELLLLKQMGASYYDICKLINFEIICLFIVATVFGLVISGSLLSFMLIYFLTLMIVNAVVIYFGIERGVI